MDRLPTIAELLLRIDELSARIDKLENIQKHKTSVLVGGSSPSAQAYFKEAVSKPNRERGDVSGR